MSHYYRMPDLWRQIYPKKPMVNDIITLAAICHLCDYVTMEGDFSARMIAKTAGLPVSTCLRSIERLKLAQIIVHETNQKVVHFKVLLLKESERHCGTQNGTQNGTQDGTQYNNINNNNNNNNKLTPTSGLSFLKNAPARARDLEGYALSDNPWEEIGLRLRDVMAYCYCTQFEAKRATQAWYRAMKAKGKRYTSRDDAKQHCLDWCFKKYFKREEIWSLQDHEELTRLRPGQGT